MNKKILRRETILMVIKGCSWAGGVVCRQVFKKVVQAGLVFSLAGCATQTHDLVRSSAAEGVREQNISAALLEGKSEVAREFLSAALRANPQNGYLHLLNGLSYQLADGSQQSLELARVGYDAAVKFAPGYFWSHYFSGLVELNRRAYSKAAEQFSSAILDKPDRANAFMGLAVSAYYAGDLGVARVAAERALALAPEDPLAFRTAAYVAAANGDRDYLNVVIEKAKALPVPARDLESHSSRLSQILRIAAQDQGSGSSDSQPLPDQPPAAADPIAGENLRQVMVEVTLMLSQDATTRRTGINLLDGLTLQFGLQRQTEDRADSSLGDAVTRIFTTSLQIPQITYSLDLFNTREDFYEVIARPSLVASLGEQSEFFIGRTLTVGVSGINLGSLLPIDVGTTIKVTPTEISRERTKFRIEATRSFFDPESAGTFSESVATFRQTVGSSVEVVFGETLILSGLYETVSIGGSSRVPILGEIPGLDVLFDSRARTRRWDAALVLVTPRLPGSIETGTRAFRSETLTKLLALWKDLVDPISNVDAVINKFGGKMIYFHPQAGDLKLPSATDPKTVRLVVDETMARLGY